MATPQQDTVTFEEYVFGNFSDKHIKTFQLIIQQYGVFGYLKTMIPDLRGKYVKQPREGYSFILSNCRYLHKVCKDKNLKEYPDVVSLMKGLYDLDTQCGDTPELKPDMDSETFQKCLNLIDLDRQKFKRLFVKDYHEIKDPVPQNVFVEFGRLIFQFNGYQAPLRLNPEKAMQDAMGLTDLFTEFLEEVQITPSV